MKTFSLLASLCIMLCSPSDGKALSTSGYTLLPVCNPSITVTSLSSTTDCFSFTSSIIHPGAPDSYYTWNFGDGTPTEIGRTLYHCYASETVPGNTARTVTLSYFNTALNCAGNATATLNVQVIPTSTCPANVPPGFSLAARTVTVWAGSTIPEIITRYDFGDGTGVGSNAIHTYTTCGSYIVKVISWDMNTPNNVCYLYAAVNISCSTPTGIAELPAEPFISAFPNPTSDLMHVKAKELVKTITVTDLLGKTLLSETEINPAEPLIRTSHLVPGTYFMTVGLESGARKSLLFIKQ
jgi:hypothetical protein